MGKQVAPVIDAECPDLSRTAPQRVEAEKDDGGGRRQRQERGRCGCCSDRQRRPRNYRLIFNRVAVREFCYTRYSPYIPAVLNALSASQGLSHWLSAYCF